MLWEEYENSGFILEKVGGQLMPDRPNMALSGILHMTYPKEFYLGKKMKTIKGLLLNGRDLQKVNLLSFQSD